MLSPPEPFAPAQLVLEDGSAFSGLSFGAAVPATGEVCFNTGMCGYQEVLTDPSYAGQIVVMTAPHIGNTGICLFDAESSRPHVAGFVVRNLSHPSNWRSYEDLSHYLERHGIPGLFDIDTRCLTRHLREHGTQKGAMGSTVQSPAEMQRVAAASPGLEQQDLVSAVTCPAIYQWSPTVERSPQEMRYTTYAVGPGAVVDAAPLHIVVYDFGVKANILHRLGARGCRLTVVPATTTAEQVLQLKPHGVLLSNGPGDPQAVDYAVAAVKTLLGTVPLFGICLGHQILGLALGGRSYKLKFGHRGMNHPVHDRRAGKVRITSQNHGFALDPASLKGRDLEIIESSLNDGTIEAIQHRTLPAFSLQYHPEAAPGPHDNDVHFDHFLKLSAEHAGITLAARASSRRGGRDAAA